MQVPEDFKDDVRVDETTKCWNWLLGCTRGGYGKLLWKGKQSYIHRVMYELLREPIPQELTIDHLCRNTRCCNPEHLEAVTMSENLSRAPHGDRQSEDFCSRGHDLRISGNLYTAHLKRICRVCKNERTREWAARYKLRLNHGLS